jgi:DNA-binding NarL/FixJ family response regulator
MHDPSPMQQTVLIVDDHEGFRRLARRMLAADGWTVVGEAVDGASAVDAAERLRPELVLLDLNLPDASGLEVAERLAGAPGAPAVVLTSTHEDEELATLAQARSARGFIPKRTLSGRALSATLSPG